MSVSGPHGNVTSEAPSDGDPSPRTTGPGGESSNSQPQGKCRVRMWGWAKARPHSALQVDMS